jgi:hypothetical protein
MLLSICAKQNQENRAAGFRRPGYKRYLGKTHQGLRPGAQSRNAGRHIKHIGN